MNLMVFGMALPWLLIAFGCWLVTGFLRQNGRILLRLEALEDQIEQIAEAQENDRTATDGSPALRNGHRPLSESRLQRDGLPKGTPAPEFRLPRLGGMELALSEYRGMKVLLVFSDPHCGPCDALAPELEAASRQRPDVQVLMVSRGEADDNRKKVKQYRLTFPVVLQRRWEISKLYAMFATPIGYLIDEEGKTTSEVAVGAEAILAQLSGASPKSAPQEVTPLP